jgi:hypothetical protein
MKKNDIVTLRCRGDKLFTITYVGNTKVCVIGEGGEEELVSKAMVRAIVNEYKEGA